MNGHGMTTEEWLRTHLDRAPVLTDRQRHAVLQRCHKAAKRAKAETAEKKTAHT